MWASLIPMKVEGMHLKPNSSSAVTVVLRDRMAQPKADSVRLTVAGNSADKDQALGHIPNSFLSSAELAQGERCKSPTHIQHQGLKKHLMSNIH